MAFKKYKCIICNWVYDESLGAPKEGIKPGTKWEEIPIDWVCPNCGASKQEFKIVEI